MKIIFLDIDGVLNTGRADYNIKTCDSEAIANFNQLVKLSRAYIVVSSSWRIGEGIGSMQSILQARKVAGKVIGLTIDMTDEKRGDEIMDYIKRHPEIEKYVILDDDTEFITYIDDLKSHIITVDRKTGLTMNNVQKALNILS